MTSTEAQLTPGLPTWNIIVAAAFAVGAMTAGYIAIGWPPVIIVGGSSIVGFVMWLRKYRYGPIAPEVILPPFLLTIAGLETHMIEEYVTGFGPAISRLFACSWSEFDFLLVFTFIGPILYALTALGLFLRVRIAGFLAWFIFIGPGVAEFTHFIFPLLKPALAPHDLASLSATLPNGNVVDHMRNYWIGATGHYYFPGMYTAILPMIPGIYGIRAVLRAAKRREQAQAV